MQTKKWLTYTLGVLFTLIALAVVGLAGFRLGMMRKATFVRMPMAAGPSFRPNFGNNGQISQAGTPRNNSGQMPQGNTPSNNNGKPNGNYNFSGRWGMPGGPRFNNFDHRGFGDRRGGPHMFFFPFFGLIQLAVLVLLIWGGYKLFQKSGWRLVRVETAASVTPIENENPKSEIKVKKNKSR